MTSDKVPAKLEQNWNYCTIFNVFL